MATTDLIPFHQEGDTVTARANGNIVGKTLLAINGPRIDDLYLVSTADEVGGAGASGYFGAAGRSAADGANLVVYRPGSVIPITVGADALNAGQAVKADDDGKLIGAANGDLAAGIICDDADAGDDGILAFVPFTVSGAVGTAVVGDQPHIDHLTNNTAGAAADGTIGAIPSPADTPATADALRDDLVANTIPAIRDALTELATTVNAILASDETAGLRVP